jgi:hypothetical protein
MSEHAWGALLPVFLLCAPVAMAVWELMQMGEIPKLGEMSKPKT